MVGLRLDGLGVECHPVSQRFEDGILLFGFGLQYEEVVARFRILLVLLREVCDDFGEIFEGGEVSRRDVLQFAEA